MYCKLLYFNTRHEWNYQDGNYSWNEYTQKDIEIENIDELLSTININHNFPSIVLIDNIFYKVRYKNNTEYVLEEIPYE